MGTQTYLVALGGNVRTRFGRPANLLAHVALPGEKGRSRTLVSRPQGPSRRRFANAVALLETPLDPPALLAELQALERAYGRRRARRWGARPLDLDIIGWSGGIWTTPGLAIPHPAYRARAFVLRPLVELAPAWRDPVSGLTPRQLLARLDRRPRSP